MSEPSSISREEVLQANPLLKHLEFLGVAIKKTATDANEKKANRCAKTQHGKEHWCVSINVEKEIWFCNDCAVGGSVIDWLAIEKGVSANVVFREMAMKLGGEKPKESAPPASRIPVKIYDYTDEQGNLLYQVCRYEPKDFRQRQPDSSGGWKWNMDGVTRVLYRLPQVLGSQTVVCAEGEKDCDTLAEMGWAATCNVGGAEKWLDAYTDFLAGKDIIIVPDNDEKGQKHAKLIAASLDERANSIKVVGMPKPYKDASDFVAGQPDRVKAAQAIRDLFEKSPHTIKPLPLYTIEEMEGLYIKMHSQEHENSVSLSSFLPSFSSLRPFIPGEVIVLIASTGVGKTVVAQKIAQCASPLPTLFFELELPAELMFERFAQMQNDCDGYEVESYYKKGRTPVAASFSGLKHVLLCPETGLTPDQIERYIERSALKFGRRPVLVVVDYLGLVRGRGISRYEVVSNAAESLRIIAKRTNTIVFSTVQISRPEKRNEGLEVGLYDAKDSGSIENSASLVIGAWRPDRDTLMLKVLKNTKGYSGRTVECNFSGARMHISERAKIRGEDVPKLPL